MNELLSTVAGIVGPVLAIGCIVYQHRIIKTLQRDLDEERSSYDRFDPNALRMRIVITPRPDDPEQFVADLMQRVGQREPPREPWQG